MESFSHPSIKLAAVGLALIALIAFAMGFKENFVRPSDATGHYTAPSEPASSLGEPTPAQAFTEPPPSSAVAPESAPAKPITKPKPVAAPDDEADYGDAAAAPVLIKPISVAPSTAATPQIVTPPKLAPKAAPKVSAAAKVTPPSSATPKAKVAPESIDDLLPPH